MDDDEVMRDVPHYWMHEASGVLRLAVEAWLEHRESAAHRRTLVAYFTQWIEAPCWLGPEADELRLSVRGLETRFDLERWLDMAIRAGLDPI